MSFETAHFGGSVGQTKISRSPVRLRELGGIVLDVSTTQLLDLSSWSIEGRYPADLRDATAADAAAAIDVAESVLAAARRWVDGRW